MKKILITGGAGFCGSNLARYFHSLGVEVHVADNLVRRGSEQNILEFRQKGIKFFHADVRNTDDFNQFDKDYDVLLETAAQASAVNYANPIFDFTNNTVGLINSLEFCRHNSIPLIFWSTNKTISGDKVNELKRQEMKTRWEWHQDQGQFNLFKLGNINEGRPATKEMFDKLRKMLEEPIWGKNIVWNEDIEIETIGQSIAGFDPIYGINEDFNPDGGQHSIYGASKIAADLWVQEYWDAYGLPTVVNRFSCLSGTYQWGMSEQAWVSWFCIANILELPIQYIGWSGKQVRDCLFAPDLCNLIEKEINNISNIGGEVFTVGGGKDITTSLIECVDTIEGITGKKTETSYEPEPRKADHAIYISDIRKAERVLDWKPKVGMQEGLTQIIEWVHNNRTILEGLYK